MMKIRTLSTLLLCLLVLALGGCSKEPVTTEGLASEVKTLVDQSKAWQKDTGNKELAGQALETAKQVLDRYEETEVGEKHKKVLESVRLLKTSLGFAKSAADPYKVPGNSTSSPFDLVASSTALVASAAEKLKGE